MPWLEPIEKAVEAAHPVRLAFNSTVAQSYSEAGLAAVEADHSPAVKAILSRSWAQIARDSNDPDKVATHLRQLERDLSTHFAAAAHQGVTHLNGLPTPFRVRFDLSAPEAAGWAATRAAALVSSIGDDVRQVIRSHVTNATLDGTGPAPLALRLARYVGLTPRDAKAVAALEAASVKAGMSTVHAARSANAYAGRLKEVRATNIARTELLTASNFGQSTAWRNAVKAGQLPPEVRRRWLTASTESACELCAPMHGLTAPVNGAFKADGRAIYHPPLHPQCRCTLALWHPSFER